MPLNFTTQSSQLYVPVAQRMPSVRMWTMATFARFSSIDGNYHSAFYRGDNGARGYVFVGVNNSNDLHFESNYQTIVTTASPAAAVQDVWYFFAVTYANYLSKQQFKYYYSLATSGTQAGAGGVLTRTQTSPSGGWELPDSPASDQIGIGSDLADTLSMVGHIAGFRMWNTPLSMAELALEARQLRAVRRKDLYFELPGHDATGRPTFGPRPTKSGTINRSSIEAPVPYQVRRAVS